MKEPLLVLLTLAISGCSTPKQNQKPKQVVLSQVDKNFIGVMESGLSLETVYVLVTVTDGNTKITKTGCTSANGLLGAIHRERGLDYDERSMNLVKQLALSMPLRQFTFSKTDALANIDFKHLDTDYPEICALVREGWGVWRPDFGGLQTDKPGYHFKSQAG